MKGHFYQMQSKDLICSFEIRHIPPNTIEDSLLELTITTATTRHPLGEIETAILTLYYPGMRLQVIIDHQFWEVMKGLHLPRILLVSSLMIHQTLSSASRIELEKELASSGIKEHRRKTSLLQADQQFVVVH
jgi:hypothetical protein